MRLKSDDPPATPKLDTSSYPVCWKIALAVCEVSRITLLYGPPGTGKTTAAVKVTSDYTHEVSNITLTEETPAVELRGFFVPVRGEFEWRDGPALKVWREGGRLVLNEIDHASGDCLTFLLALLDDPEVAMMTLPTKETVIPHQNFSCVATMNGEPDDLPSALKDRFAVRVKIDVPHPQAVESLPAKLRPIALNHLTHSKPGLRFGIRSWKAYASLAHQIGAEDAAAAVFENRAEEVIDAMRIAGAS